MRKIEFLWMQMARSKKKESLDRFLRNKFNVMKLENTPFSKVPKILEALEAICRQNQNASG